MDEHHAPYDSMEEHPEVAYVRFLLGDTQPSQLEFDAESRALFNLFDECEEERTGASSMVSPYTK